MSQAAFRIRVRYRKDGRLRFLGHLEVLRTIDRCVRRSELPFSVTNGFSPHMRIAFSAALATGTSSSCEYYDLCLDSLVKADEALARLASATPRDLSPDACGYVDMRLRALETWITRASWEVAIPGGLADPSGLENAIAQVVEGGRIDFERGGKPKSVDLSKALVGWDMTGDETSCRLCLQTRSGDWGSLRPNLLLTEAARRAGIDPNVTSACHVRRVGQWHEGEDGLVDPMEPCATTATRMNLA